VDAAVAATRATGTVTTTGRGFTTTSVQIIRIRDGHIVHSRDFADPRILEDAIGRGGGNHGPFGEKSS
jgi:ketosteroid isomerase-like protein